MEATELVPHLFSSFTKGTSFGHLADTAWYKSLIAVNLGIIGGFEYRLATPKLFSDSLRAPAENQCEEDHAQQSRGL